MSSESESQGASGNGSVSVSQSDHSDKDFCVDGDSQKVGSEKLSLYSDLQSSVVAKQRKALASDEVVETEECSITDEGESEFVMSNSNSASQGFSAHDVENFSTRHLERKIVVINSGESDTVTLNASEVVKTKRLPKRRCTQKEPQSDAENAHPLNHSKMVNVGQKEKGKRFSLFSTPLDKNKAKMKKREQLKSGSPVKSKCLEKQKVLSNVEQSEPVSGDLQTQNIRAQLPETKLEQDTKIANRMEEERLMRLSKRDNDGMTDFYTEDTGNIVVYTRFCFEKNSDGTDRVSMHKDVVKHLKVHQVEGVQFLWDNTVESVELANNTPGSGAILAHCMGLGKSLQVVSFLHTLLKESSLPFRTALIIVPTNTILNWVNEFEIWLPESERLHVVEISQEKDEKHRSKVLSKWYQTGGVMIIGYQMFRSCVGSKRVMERKVKQRFKHTLLSPGPDMVVCDEGHLLKNDESALSKSVAKISTRRRIALTGTPLQNNLLEYHCMVNFVKPNLLGTKTEFKNQFVNPIESGQRKDASEIDVKVMKHRSHVLHELLAGGVQRRDYSYITKFLPPKYEYVLSVRMTKKQVLLYRKYIDVFCKNETTAKGKEKNQPRRSLFRDYQSLAKIWTHPGLLLFEEIVEADVTDGKSPDRESKKNTSKEVSHKTSVGGGDGKHKEETKTKLDTSGKKKRSSGSTPSPWFGDILKKEDECDLLISGKYVLLLDVLKGAHVMQEKVLVFSQSLATLTLIEDILELVSDAAAASKRNAKKSSSKEKEKKGKEPTYCINGTETGNGSWEYGKDYVRLDGSSSAPFRKEMCDKFNCPENRRCRLFLISTRAGSLGVNLVAANRVIIFDASWNPSHDIQSMFRCYRFGQKKPVYVYRFIAQGTMEEKVYNRQVNKESLSLRVIDENQIDRHFSRDELEDLYKFEPVVYSKYKPGSNPVCSIPKDEVLAEILLKRKEFLYRYHEHDSLLEHKEDENLNDEDKIAAWKEYEKERKGIRFLARKQTRDATMAPKTADEKVGDEVFDVNGLPAADYAGYEFVEVQQQMVDWGANITHEKSNETFVKLVMYQFVKSIFKENPGADELHLVKSLFEKFPTFYLKALGIEESDKERDENVEKNSEKHVDESLMESDDAQSSFMMRDESRSSRVRSRVLSGSSGRMRRRKRSLPIHPRRIKPRKRVLMLGSTSESNRRPDSTSSIVSVTREQIITARSSLVNNRQAVNNSTECNYAQVDNRAQTSTEKTSVDQQAKQTAVTVSSDSSIMSIDIF